MESLQELLVDELQDLYDAEKQLVKALPKMAKAAANEELKSAFQEHLSVTEQHVQRLEQVFELLGEKAKTKPCKAMKGLVEEGAEVIGEDYEADIKDAALIGAAQRVEHYEIAGYGTARAMAEALGLNEAAELLEQTEDEEGDADKKLTEIAETIYGELGASGEESDSEVDDEEETVETAETERKPVKSVAGTRGTTKKTGSRR